MPSLRCRDNCVAGRGLGTTAFLTQRANILELHIFFEPFYLPSIPHLHSSHRYPEILGFVIASTSLSLSHFVSFEFEIWQAEDFEVGGELEGGFSAKQSSCLDWGAYLKLNSVTRQSTSPSCVFHRRLRASFTCWSPNRHMSRQALSRQKTRFKTTWTGSSIYSTVKPRALVYTVVYPVNTAVSEAKLATQMRIP